MSTTSEREPFVEARFLDDLEKGSELLSAPFNKHVLQEVVNAYRDLIDDAAIQIRSTSTPGNPISFRLFIATRADTLQIAEAQGWLHPDDPVPNLVRAIRTQCDGSIEQPEFTADKGCDAMLMYLNGLRDLDFILATPGMPDAIKANRQKFRDADLNQLVVTHFDYPKELVSFYFLGQGPLSKAQLDKLVALTGAPPPSDDVYNDIVGVLLDSSYYLTVSMDYHTGRIVRIELHLFFPVKLPPDMSIPTVGQRLETFWDIPTYESEEMDVLSYCFGDTEKTGDILALRGYCGGFREVMRSWSIIGA
ncbi:hypothetical protein KVR01_003590 [Diaporthe batatas]|uniref:uncharacterized protein n=1 Tax=Diaporthe batatas TaxID=748121 RepID=UPI001D043FED|nr:uncharacterized protein KVR01_003590 [Diaporthe batatas]KAG8167901.1 hypothetical protein KVR01_003590 [Diaporthe batatas]